MIETHPLNERNEAHRNRVNGPETADEAWSKHARGNEAPRAHEANGANGAHAVLRGFTALELQGMRFPPIKFVVPGFVVEGLTLFAGKPKIGKSWLLLHAAIAVARGGATLGDIQCVEGNVLYCALEDNPRRLQNRMTKLSGLQDWPTRLEFTTELPRLKDGGVERVRQWIKAVERPRLVVIDTLAKVRDAKGHEQSSYEADYAAVGELKALADQYGIAIVLVHHQRKMEAEDPIDTVSGTTGLTGAVDTVLVLYRNGQGTTLFGKGRDIEEVEKAVSFDAEFCLWRVEGEARDVHRSGERTAVIAVLEDASEPLSPREIADLARLPPKSIRMMLTRMVKAGEIMRKGRGCYMAKPKPACDNGYKGYNAGADQAAL
jgi:hypothetical protein